MGYMVIIIFGAEDTIITLSIPFMGYKIEYRIVEYGIPDFQFPLWDTQNSIFE